MDTKELIEWFDLELKEISVGPQRRKIYLATIAKLVEQLEAEGKK